MKDRDEAVAAQLMHADVLLEASQGLALLWLGSSTFDPMFNLLAANPRSQALAVSLIFAVAVAACSSQPEPSVSSPEIDERADEIYEGIFGEGPDPFSGNDEAFRQCIADADLPELEEESEDPDADRQTAFE